MCKSFQAIVQAESLDENFTLGLAVLLAGDFAMLPPDTKLNKVAPPGWLSSGKSKGLLGLPTSFMLYLRLRFFLPSLRGTRFVRTEQYVRFNFISTTTNLPIHFQELDIEASVISTNKAMYTGAAAGLPIF